MIVGVTYQQIHLDLTLADFLYLYFLDLFAEALNIQRLGELQDVLDVQDLRLLELLHDVRQLDTASLPEGNLLQQTTVVPHLHRLLTVQQLLDLICPVDDDS